MTGYLDRDVSGRLAASLASMPVVVLSGPRQCGKTTFLKHDAALRGRRFLTLDDPAVLAVASRDPDRFLESDAPLTIDEAQKCPALFPALKRAVDRRRENGLFLLSGSANFLLLDAVGESLAGRAVYLFLHPLSQRELTRSCQRRPWLVDFLETGSPPDRASANPVDDRAILDGGFPSVATGAVRDREIWFTGYEQTYLERDLRDLSQVVDLGAFRRVLGLCALRSAQLVNESEVAREAKVSSSTAGRYVDLLETSCIAHRLAPFTRSRASRIVKTSKLHLCDSGLAAHLIGVDELTPRGGERFRGPLIETWVAQNLRSITSAHLPRSELSFFNVQGRHEVDFIVTHRRKHVGIEVKAGRDIDEADGRGLRAFAASVDGVQGLIVAYGGRETLEIDEGLYAVPMERLLG